MDEEWIFLINRSAVPAGDVIGVIADGLNLAIYDLDGEIYATDNMCSHGHARLSDGFLEGGAIECPLHQGKFDPKTGLPLCNPVTVPVKTYAVKVEGGNIFVLIDTSVAT